MIISSFIEVAWFLWLSCQLGPRSSTKDTKGISVKVRKKQPCPFLKNVLFVHNLEWLKKTAQALQTEICMSGESRLSYNFVTSFLVVEILSAGGKLFLWIKRFVRLWELYQLVFWSEADSTPVEGDAWDGGFFLKFWDGYLWNQLLKDNCQMACVLVIMGIHVWTRVFTNRYSRAAEVELSSTGGISVVGTEWSKVFQIGHDCYLPSS
jgi:hypothetical protein